MTDDIKVLTMWIFICVVIASIGTTAVPILYAFFPWRLRPIGKLFMLQSISFALAIDLTALFLVWPLDNVQVLFWINALVFTFIAATTASMATWLLRMLVRMCRPKKEGNENVSAE